MSRRTRPWRRAIAALALGAVTTVLVAWACVYGPRTPGAAIAGLGDADRAAWLARAPAGLGFAFGASALRLPVRGTGVDAVDIGTYRTDDPFVESGHIMTIRAGWPLRCLHGERWFVRSAVDGEREHVRGLWNAPLRRRATIGGAPTTLVTSLPLRPLPLGFALNALLYGAAWWGANALVVAVARRRRPRGAERCAACGYDLTGATSARCPECGRAAAGSRSTRP